MRTRPWAAPREAAHCSVVGSAAKCRGPEALVSGVVKCVHVGDKCQKKYSRQYIVGDLVCARVGRPGHRTLRLRRAGYAAARQGRIIDIGSNGRLTFQQAKWYFAQTVARLPGIKVPRGAVGRDTSGTDAIKSLDLFRHRLTAGQLRVLDAAIVPPGKPGAVVNADGTVATAQRAVRARRAIALSGLSGTLSEAVMRLRQHGVFVSRTRPRTQRRDGARAPCALGRSGSTGG